MEKNPSVALKSFQEIDSRLSEVVASTSLDKPLRLTALTPYHQEFDSTFGREVGRPSSSFCTSSVGRSCLVYTASSPLADHRSVLDRPRARLLRCVPSPMSFDFLCCCNIHRPCSSSSSPPILVLYTYSVPFNTTHGHFPHSSGSSASMRYTTTVSCGSSRPGSSISRYPRTLGSHRVR